MRCLLLGRQHWAISALLCLAPQHTFPVLMLGELQALVQGLRHTTEAQRLLMVAAMVSMAETHMMTGQGLVRMEQVVVVAVPVNASVTAKGIATVIGSGIGTVAGIASAIGSESENGKESGRENGKGNERGSVKGTRSVTPDAVETRRGTGGTLTRTGAPQLTRLPHLTSRRMSQHLVPETPQSPLPLQPPPHIPAASLAQRAAAAPRHVPGGRSTQCLCPRHA
mmetsp:Transcript_19965/g.43460  ORF Transcript_19965/g.43460 Transcript_19965/m.43460 type:complete len:224 (-) Transcript_19965:2374-3045(-)